VSRAKGFGRLLVAIYGVFAISAIARASFQIVTKFESAPLAYSLSALAAAVYLVATLALALPGKVWGTVAWIAVGFEFAGVFIVGALSLLEPNLFDHPTVWSQFGAGYGFVPLVLPVIGIAWLLRVRTHGTREAVS
jgi:hypothetical protein